MLRTPFASERIQRVDPETGVRVIQLTSYPLPSAHFLYDWPFITPDNARLVLWCQRTARRDGPWDLFRVDTDGLNLYQLTERGERSEAGGYYGRPASRLTLDGRLVYCVWGTTLCSVDVETGETEELCSLHEHCTQGNAVSRLHIGFSGRLFVVHNGPAGWGTLRVDLDSGAVDPLDLGGHLFACDPTAPRLVVSKGEVIWDTETRKNGSRIVTNRGEERAKWLMDEDGNDLESFCPEMFAHATLLGNRLAVQGCGKPPHRCIWLAEHGEEPRKLAQGPYFWHSGASWNGEWIVSDTNWPDQGLQLVHVGTGHFGTVCRAGASQDHYEFGHPHPALSQDGSMCVFRSDRTGLPQLYIAHIPDEFRQRVIAGELSPSVAWP